MSLGGKVTEVSKVSKVSTAAGESRSDERKVSNVADGTKVVNAAFKPFENSVYDINGFLRLIDEITLIERSIFRGKEGTISEKAKDFTTSNIIFLFQEIEKIGLEPAGDAKQVAFLKELVAYLKTLPIVKVAIAFEPTNSFLMKLNSDITNVMGRKVILDLVINEYIVGGAVFEYGGKVSKQTLDTSLDSVLGKIVPKTLN